MVRRWSNEEEMYLIDNWDVKDISVLMKTLDRTEDSIVRKAERLGLNVHKDPNEYLRKRWSEEEDKILLELYHSVSTEELLKLLPNRTKGSIIKRAKALCINEENRRWLDEEVTYLEEKWGIISVDCIAKKLGRTKNAILLKAHKIGLREQSIANGTYLTPKDISSVLGVGTRTVYNWMKLGYLKYKRLKVNSVKKYQITTSNFKMFLESYQDKWDARNADIVFINCCFTTCRSSEASNLPNWLMDKVKLDKQKETLKLVKPWTVKEEAVLQCMINIGKTHQEIACILKRSVFSVRGKAYSKKREQLYDNVIIPINTNKINKISNVV